jgi:hypothetical protein
MRCSFIKEGKRTQLRDKAKPSRAYLLVGQLPKELSTPYSPTAEVDQALAESGRASEPGQCHTVPLDNASVGRR